MEKEEDKEEKTNPNSNRFLTSCFLTLARPKKKGEERSRGGRAKEALCLEVSANLKRLLHPSRLSILEPACLWRTVEPLEIICLCFSQNCMC